MENTDIKLILEKYIQDGSKTLVECLKEICTTAKLQNEFSALACLEKIMLNNKEIAEYNDKHMWESSAKLCTMNSALYDKVSELLKAAKKTEVKEEKIVVNTSANIVSDAQPVLNQVSVEDTSKNIEVEAQAQTSSNSFFSKFK